MDESNSLTSDISILLVEDQENVRDMVKDILEDEGYKVKDVEDGEKGLSELLANHYDVCITDYSMPNKTGVEMIKEYKTKAHDSKTKFIGSSGFDASTAEPLFKKEGAEFIQKPYAFNDLYAIIERVLKQ